MSRRDWILSYTPLDFHLDDDQADHVMGVRNLGALGPLGKMVDDCDGFWNDQRAGSTVILNSYKLVNSNFDGRQMVATHELGHFIGGRHSRVTEAVLNSPLHYPEIYYAGDDDECAINDRYDHEGYPVDCD